MNNGWPRKTLGEICGFVRGPFGGSLKKAVFVSDGFAVYEQQHAIYNQFEDIRYFIDDEKFREMQRFELRPNDLIMSCSGTMGRVAIVPQSIRRGIINQALLKLTPSKAVSPEFLKYWMDSTNFQDSLKEQSGGAAIQNVASVGILKEILIPLPPLPEQRRIVGILDEAFDGIATAKANAEKNLQNARALFESHLQAVFTQRGEGWVEKRLEEIANVLGRGKSRHRPRNEPKLYGGKYPFIQTGDVRNAGLIIESHSQTYSEMGLAQSKLWPKGTVCITIAANIAETAILGFDACIPDSIIGVVVDEAKADNKFLLYLLRSFKVHLQAQGKGSAQDNINMGTFENQTFPFPSLSNQQKIVKTLDELADETQRLATIYQRKLAALDELKKSLLHQAFSGNL
ncbi:MAG TPA: restriction endonuclease subunit S [Gemmatales bacterium]|nr:restriction endonuclease subunit S [Gemmatales bacterium]